MRPKMPGFTIPRLMEETRRSRKYIMTLFHKVYPNEELKKPFILTEQQFMFLSIEAKKDISSSIQSMSRELNVDPQALIRFCKKHYGLQKSEHGRITIPLAMQKEIMKEFRGRKKKRASSETFGGRLTLVLLKKKSSPKILADFLGISEKTVDQWVRDKNYPTVEKLIKICKHLEISADYLLGLGGA